MARHSQSCPDSGSRNLRGATGEAGLCAGKHSDEHRMRLAFLGDCCLTDGFEKLVATDPKADLLGDVGTELGADTVVCGNIECVVSERGRPNSEKYATLRAHPAVVRALRQFDVAVVANNHVGDFGCDAMLDTKKHLEASGIQTVGLGANVEQAVQPAIVERAGVRVGILAFSCLTTNGRNLATKDTPGVAPLHMPLILRTVADVRNHVDALFVVLHWGAEGKHAPNVDQLRIASSLCDLGVDGVVGTHAHVVQAYERLGNSYCFYGLGNFLFPSITCMQHDEDGKRVVSELKRPPRERESLIPIFDIAKRGDGGAAIGRLLCTSFSESLVPEIKRIEDLTFDVQRLNRDLLRFRHRHRQLLRSAGPMEYRTVLKYGTGIPSHYYASTCFTSYRCRWAEMPWRAARRLKGMIRQLTAFPQLAAKKEEKL